MRTIWMLASVMVVAAPLYAGPAPSGDPEPIYYVRFGTGAVFADRTFMGPAIGIGFRGQLDSVAIDVSMNLQAISPSDRNGSGVVAGSLVNLRILRLITPEAERSAYAGGGMSWGGVDMNGSKYPYDTAHGTGLQAEITGGYEFARQKPVRLFLEANVVLPFYEAQSSTVRSAPSFSAIGIDHGYRYAPSMTLSFGVGWQR